MLTGLPQRNNQAAPLRRPTLATPAVARPAAPASPEYTPGGPEYVPGGAASSPGTAAALQAMVPWAEMLNRIAGLEIGSRALSQKLGARTARLQRTMEDDVAAVRNKLGTQLTRLQKTDDQVFAKVNALETKCVTRLARIDRQLELNNLERDKLSAQMDRIERMILRLDNSSR